MSIWPCTSSDWAAWVQAFGTVGAVIAAWLFSRNDRRVVSEREYDAKLRDEFFAAQVAARFPMTLVEDLLWLSGALDSSNRVEIAFAFQRVSETLNWARSLSLESVSTDIVYQFERTRFVAASVMWCEKNLRGRAQRNAISLLYGRAAGCSGEMEKALMAAFPEIPSYALRRFGMKIRPPTRWARTRAWLRKLVPAFLRG